MRLSRTLVLSMSALLLALSAPAVNAAVITQTYSGTGPVSGTLPSVDTVLDESITVAAPSYLTAASTSYATGGLQGTFSLFDNSGNFLDAAGATAPPGAMNDPKTNLALDAYLNSMVLLNPGTYVLQFRDFEYDLGVTGTTFTDAQGNVRTNAYSFNINLTPAAAVPEPSTALLSFPIAGLVLLARKRFSAAN